MIYTVRTQQYIQSSASSMATCFGPFLDHRMVNFSNLRTVWWAENN